MRGDQLYLALTAVALILIFLRRRTLPWGRKAVLVASLAVLGFLRLDLPSIHCIVEGFFSRLSLDFFKTPMLVKLGAAFLIAPLVGRVFCGYVCPKGAAQELIYLRRWRLRVPRKLDRVLRLVPYLSLAALIAFPILYQRRIWAELDPFIWLFHAHGHLAGLILLGVVLPLSVFLFRPFCRYLCPLVPIFRLLSRPALLRRRADRALCRGCKAGRKACDFDVIDLKLPKRRREGSEDEERPEKPACRFSAAECLHCGRCEKKCPRDAIR